MYTYIWRTIKEKEAKGLEIGRNQERAVHERSWKKERGNDTGNSNFKQYNFN